MNFFINVNKLEYFLYHIDDIENICVYKNSNGLIATHI